MQAYYTVYIFIPLLLALSLVYYQDGHEGVGPEDDLCKSIIYIFIPLIVRLSLVYYQDGHKGVGTIWIRIQGHAINFDRKN